MDGWPGLSPGISGEGAEPLIQNFWCPSFAVCFGRAGFLSVSPSRNSNDACPDALPYQAQNRNCLKCPCTML